MNPLSVFRADSTCRCVDAPTKCTLSVAEHQANFLATLRAIAASISLHPTPEDDQLAAGVADYVRRMGVDLDRDGLAVTLGFALGVDGILQSASSVGQAPDQAMAVLGYCSARSIASLLYIMGDRLPP